MPLAEDVTTLMEDQVRDAWGKALSLGKGLLSEPDVIKDLSWMFSGEQQTLLVS